MLIRPVVNCRLRGQGVQARPTLQAPCKTPINRLVFGAMKPLETLEYTIAQAKLGTVFVGQSAHGICAVLIGDDAATLYADACRRFSGTTCIRNDEKLRAAARAIAAHIDAPSTVLPLALDMCGTAFQQSVWRVLRGIAAGHTITYAQLAQRIGRPSAVRAVANACAANPLAVVVPCHRVLRSDGALGGYAWGVARKKQLLAAETIPNSASAGTAAA